jgi:hypothetical protein
VSEAGRTARDRRLLAIALGAGVLLALIGVRFWVSPERASAFFGIGARPEPYALQAVVALRDLWLGVLAVAFAIERQWRALLWWLTFGAGVCLADAGVVIAAGGPGRAIAFHVVSGIVCAALAVAIVRRRPSSSG